MEKVSLGHILSAKGKRKLVMLTAYDALFAKLFDPYTDILLVGDSLNMVFAGAQDTLSATMDQMIYHTQAVCRGAQRSFIVFDMPYGSYTDPSTALANGLRVYKETRADSVKLEGGAEKAEVIATLVENGIAVMGHIGLMPQHVRGEGGYRIKRDRERVVEDALAVEEAGAFSLVLEGVQADIAAAVTEELKIPVIGIGAGRDVDGQVLVWTDMLGFFTEFKPKFVRRYLEGAQLVDGALRRYVEDVRSGRFPSEKESY
ncbi:MAG: 3-methyl-2-oxobutanoate hydroxymethyltransferase [Epsilonproteobacteria bacterium]|nr:3-methyl-2-oxobutanoate hydroxymethyltransferase [Campylobacterota bacterium]NPA56247.1 3-methyl-2-oxobutanoate hydroxymethyltransferase [Campylobacterota bacterium]